MNSNRNAVSAVATAAFAVVIAGPAGAATLYFARVSGEQIDPRGSDSAISAGGYYSDPTDVGVGKTNYSAGADTSAAHGGIASSTVSVAPINPSSTYPYAQTLVAESTIRYQVTLKGSGPAASVPVQIKAGGAINWAQDGYAEASFLFSDYSDPFGFAQIYDRVYTTEPGKDRLTGNAAFGVDQTVLLKPGHIYNVVLATNAEVDARDIMSTSEWGEGNAVVDPTFTVLGHYAADWSIDGVPTASASGAPEPGLWAILIAGFGLAGAAMRRRRMWGRDLRSC